MASIERMKERFDEIRNDIARLAGRSGRRHKEAAGLDFGRVDRLVDPEFNRILATVRGEAENRSEYAENVNARLFCVNVPDHEADDSFGNSRFFGGRLQEASGRAETAYHESANAHLFVAK
jgi:hypothetical protein